MFPNLTKNGRSALVCSCPYHLPEALWLLQGLRLLARLSHTICKRLAFGLATNNKIGQNKEKFIYKIYKNKTNNYFIILITYYEIATADLWNAAF